MAIRRDLSRAEMLELTPSEYLRAGYRDFTGRPHRELSDAYATAAAVQLEAAKASPQEVIATLEALKQVLPWHHGQATQLIAEAAEEALEVVSNMYGQANNTGLVKWLEQCLGAVLAPEDIDAFLGHFTAVSRQYTVIIGIRTR
jgi:hypothetical protein